LKTSLVKVINIFFTDLIFCNYIPYKPKLLANNIRVFVLSPLIVVFTSILRLEEEISFYEIINLVLANYRKSRLICIKSFLK